MPPKMFLVSPVLVLLILVAAPQPDARGQGVGEPPLVLQVGSARAESAEARRKIAEELIAQREALMGRPLDSAFRARLVERVASQPLEKLRMLREGSGNRPAATDGLGDSSADLVYTPVAPCRIFDTRVSGAGALSPGAPRDFLVAGTSGFAAQGGNASGCGIPLGPATAVVVNLAAVNPTGPGNIRAWAVADPTPPAPFASVLNFGSVAGLQALANAVVLPICDGAGGVCAADLRLETFASPVQVVGDVLGYFRSAGLTADLLVGSDGFGPVAATAGTLHLGWQEVLTPGRLVDCVVTCSFTVSSTTPNVTGYASVQGGAKLVGSAGSGWGGMPMFAAPVASAGSSSATQTTQIGLGASLRFQFGCFVAAAGDFLDDEITGTVAWICR